MLRYAASLLAPPRCAVCSAPVRCEERACARCRGALQALGPVRSNLHGIEVISAARYERVARRLVAKLKFSSRLALAETAAEAMVGAWGPDRHGLLVPVPPAPARARARGFDTAWLLAALVSARTSALCRPCLERLDNGRQVGRPRADRLADPPRIRFSERARVPDEPVWLIDDVVTTGATLRECARALRAAGADEVRALTFARAR